jgi:hypothetical protein
LTGQACISCGENACWNGVLCRIGVGSLVVLQRPGRSPDDRVHLVKVEMLLEHKGQDFDRRNSFHEVERDELKIWCNGTNG